MNKINLGKFIESRYKDYSLYTMENRAIPNFFDGLKVSQRKILYVAQKKAKSNINVGALAGECKAEGKYHHGSVSLEDAIALMAKDYTGSNNIPLFKGKGNFGNIFDFTVSSSRYISVENSKAMNQIFLPQDDDILLEHPDSENPEPLYFVPIIPYVLLNGIKGMAVGYATEILSYNIKDIIHNIFAVMENKEQREMIPYYKGYKGKIVFEEDKYVMYGKIKKVNTTNITIQEIPISYTRETYSKILNDLIDNKVIKSFVNRSKNDYWHIDLKVEREFSKQTEMAILLALKLKENLNSNMNTIWEKKIVHYDDPRDIIKDFYDIRISFYKKRKTLFLAQMELKLYNRLIKLEINKFIRNLKTKAFTKDVILKFLEDDCERMISLLKRKLKKYVPNKKINFPELYNSITNSVRVLDITDDKIQGLQTEVDSLISEFNELQSTLETQLYKRDLEVLLKHVS